MKGEQGSLDILAKRRQWRAVRSTRTLCLDCANGREAVFVLTVEVIGARWSYRVRHGEATFDGDAPSERLAKVYAMRRAASLARGMKP